MIFSKIESKPPPEIEKTDLDDLQHGPKMPTERPHYYLLNDKERSYFLHKTILKGIKKKRTHTVDPLDSGLFLWPFL